MEKFQDNIGIFFTNRAKKLQSASYFLDYNNFEAYFRDEVQLFKDFMLASRIKSAFPIIITIVQEDQLFIPGEEKELLSAMLNSRFKFKTWSLIG